MVRVLKNKYCESNTNQMVWTCNEEIGMQELSKQQLARDLVDER